MGSISPQECWTSELGFLQLALCLFHLLQVVGFLGHVGLDSWAEVSPDANEAFDDFDTESEWDVVWRDTSLTSGMAAFSASERKVSFYLSGRFTKWRMEVRGPLAFT